MFVSAEPRDLMFSGTQASCAVVSCGGWALSRAVRSSDTLRPTNRTNYLRATQEVEVGPVVEVSGWRPVLLAPVSYLRQASSLRGRDRHAWTLPKPRQDVPTRLPVRLALSTVALNKTTFFSFLRVQRVSGCEPQHLPLASGCS